MSSNIDETVPPDGQRAEKAAFRSNWAAAKEEIEDLQEQISLPWQIALGIISQ